MKFTYSQLNNYLGILVSLLASITYLLTIEPNISFWDTGEYIASAAKLEVTHSPGAALFQLVGALFAGLSFGNGELYPKLINSMSAIMSGLAILFTFWSITFFMRKILETKSNFSIKDKTTQFIIFSAGLVGALVFTFSDTFWYSAVEGEVYAMGSLFMALLVWLITKWDRESEDKYSNRWLILIAFVIGLSVGVHMMVLLAVPAVCYLYYVKKHDITPKSFLIANVVVLVIFIFVFKLLFPYTMEYFGQLEIFFVNEIGLPFNSGLFIALTLLMLFFFFAIRLTRKNNLPFINLGIWAVLFMLIGFSCWMMIPIRANANPPMNLNNPDNALGMKDYYNREQYGDWPIIYGANYTAHLDKDGINKTYNTTPIYLKNEEKEKYEVSGYHFAYEYNKKHIGLFPRMYYPSNDTQVQENYGMGWGYPKIKIDPRYAGDPQVEKLVEDLKIAQKSKEISIADYKKYAEIITIEKPSIVQNIKYMFEYQIGGMFMRYFLWNFAGKQNDREWKNDQFKGNWEGGIIKNNLPDKYTNKGTNHYFYLPLILGLIGLFFQLNKDFGRFYALLSLFLLAGIGIIFYTNVKPFEPRERDYAVVGAFYVFSIWVGLGAGAILYYLQEKLKGYKKLIPVTVVLLAIPLLMAFENWDDHNRSHRHTAYDEAYSYLQPLDKNAILFVYGDNDTYPLWGVQETSQLRDDVKVVNYTLLGTSWYIDQMHRKTYTADKLPHQLQFNEFKESVNDAVKLFSKKEWKEDFFENQRVFEYFEEIGINKTIIDEFLPHVEKDSMTAKEAIAFIRKKSAGKDEMLKLFFGKDYKEYNMLPVSKIVIPVNKENCLKYGIVSQKEAHKMQDYITLDIKQGSLRKAELAMLDLLANYNWDRTLYLSSGGIVDPASTFYLNTYTEYQGFVYKIVPIHTKESADGEYGFVNADNIYKTIKQFRWGNFNHPKAHFDETGLNNIVHYRQAVGRAAEALFKENKISKAKELLDLCMDKIPVAMYPGSPSLDGIIKGYILIGEEKKGLELAKEYKKSILEEYNHYENLPPLKQKQNANIMSRLVAYYSFTSESVAKAYITLNKVDKAQTYIDESLSVWNKKFDDIIKEVSTNGGETLKNKEYNIANIYRAYGGMLASLEDIDSLYTLEKQLQLEIKMKKLEQANGGF